MFEPFYLKNQLVILFWEGCATVTAVSGSFLLMSKLIYMYPAKFITDCAFSPGLDMEHTTQEIINTCRSIIDEME